MKKKSISIIIPFMNGEKYINKIIDSLVSQRNVDFEFEIIFVNNNSNDNSLEILKSIPNIKVLNETKPGSYAARNKGVSASKYDILAFTDVDCIMRNDWLIEIQKSIQDNINICYGGSVEYIANTFSTFGLFDTLTFLNQEKNINNHSAVTANLIVPRTIFKKVGDFDSSLQSGGDIEWTRRLYEKGFELKYNKDIVVYHPIRETFNENVKKCYRVGYGNGQILKKEKRLYAFPKPGVLLPAIKNLNSSNVFNRRLNTIDKSKLISFSIIMQIVNYWGKFRGVIYSRGEQIE